MSAVNHLAQFLRDAESRVERAVWDVHCYEVALERAEKELEKRQNKLAEARGREAAARDVLAALQEKFGLIGDK